MLTVKIAAVGEYDMCAGQQPWAWRAVQEELLRVSGGKIPVVIYQDMEFADERPDLNTVEHFWDGSLGDYWRSRVPSDPGIRIVVLPPLQTPAGPMFGGMSYGGSHLRGWAYINGDLQNQNRTALIALHEIAHIIGRCLDVCHSERTQPDLMCAEDSVALKTKPDLLHYSPTCERQIRRRLGLRAGRKLCIGKECGE